RSVHDQSPAGAGGLVRRRAVGCMRHVLPLWVILLGVSCQAAPNPFAPLSAAEIRAAVRAFRDSGRLPRGAVFSLIALDEPAKDVVLRGSDPPRRAFAVIYDRIANLTWEGIADLSTSRVTGWKEIPGAQPAITGE